MNSAAKKKDTSQNTSFRINIRFSVCEKFDDVCRF